MGNTQLITNFLADSSQGRVDLDYESIDSIVLILESLGYEHVDLQVNGWDADYFISHSNGIETITLHASGYYSTRYLTR